MFYEKGVFRNFTKFTREHLCQSLFFNKADLSPASLFKKKTLAQLFFCEFCEIFKNTFFAKRLWGTASGEIYIDFVLVLEQLVLEQLSVQWENLLF